MCISGKCEASVTDVNALRCAGDVQSDNHLVACKVKVNMGWSPPRPLGKVRELVKVERLKDVKMCLRGNKGRVAATKGKKNWERGGRVVGFQGCSD